jgi:hypothetical protein
MEVLHNSRERKTKRPRENTRAIRNTLVKLFTHEMESAICYTSLGCSMLFFLPTQKVPYSRHWQSICLQDLCQVRTRKGHGPAHMIVATLLDRATRLPKSPRYFLSG